MIDLIDLSVMIRVKYNMLYVSQPMDRFLRTLLCRTNAMKATNCWDLAPSHVTLMDNGQVQYQDVFVMVRTLKILHISR